MLKMEITESILYNFKVAAIKAKSSTENYILINNFREYQDAGVYIVKVVYDPKTTSTCKSEAPTTLEAYSSYSPKYCITGTCKTVLFQAMYDSTWEGFRFAGS